MFVFGCSLLLPQLILWLILSTEPPQIYFYLHVVLTS
jgi:hypothetical protein